MLILNQHLFHMVHSSSGSKDSNQVVQGMATSMTTHRVCNNLTNSYANIHVNTSSHAKCNVGKPHHVGSTSDPLTINRISSSQLITQELISVAC